MVTQRDLLERERIFWRFPNVRISTQFHNFDVVDARRMTLSGTVVLGKATGEIPFNLLIHDVTSVVDENGDKHEWHNHVTSCAFSP